MCVDQSGEQGLAGAVDDCGTSECVDASGDACDAAVADQDVANAECFRAVEDVDVAEEGGRRLRVQCGRSGGDQQNACNSFRDGAHLASG